MKVLRVFPRRTSMTPLDNMVAIGPPGLWRPAADEVHISVTFSWDVEPGWRLAAAWGQFYPVVKLGGPAIDGEGDTFCPGMYLREGVTITSRGCVRRCPWCIVDGPVRLLEIKPGWIVQDNNLLATGRPHLTAVFQMLRQQQRAVTFAGGLDVRLLKDWMAEEIRSLRVDEVFLAADSDGTLPYLRRALDRLSFLPRYKKRCYVLWGFEGEPLVRGEARCRAAWEMGALPFAQLYQPIGGYIAWPLEVRRTVRCWQRPAIIKARMRHESGPSEAKESFRNSSLFYSCSIDKVALGCYSNTRNQTGG
jgi:hypothetical protein